MRNKVHWLSIVLAYSSLFFFGLNDNLRGPLFPEILRDLHLTDTQGSLLWGMASFFGIFGSLLMGPLLERWGIMIGLRLSVILMGLGHLGMVLSPDFASALASSMVFGLSLGLLGVLQNLLVLQAGPGESTSRLQAGLHSNYAVASLLAPLLVTALHVFLPTWRSGYLAGAVLSFLFFIYLWTISPDRVEGHHREIAKTRQRSEKAHRRALYLGCIIGLYVVAEILVSSRLSLYLQREGFNFNESSLGTGVFFLGLAAGRIALIFWKPRKSVRAALFSLLALTSLVLLIGLWRWPVLVAISGLTMAPIFPLLMAYTKENFPQDLAFATVYVITMDGIFVVSMHVLVGLSSDAFGLQRALLAGPMACLIAAGLLIADHKVMGHHNLRAAHGDR